MTSSLEILKPRAWATRKAAWKSETACKLEDLSKRLIELAANREWSNPLFENVSPDYHAEFEHSQGVPLNTWKDYVAHHERLAATNPEYRFDLLDTLADVYEDNGMATIYMLLRVTGHPPNVVRESIIVMYWTREDDKWTCQEQRVVRGMSWNA